MDRDLVRIQLNVHQQRGADGNDGAHEDYDLSAGSAPLRALSGCLLGRSADEPAVRARNPLVLHAGFVRDAPCADSVLALEVRNVPLEVHVPRANPNPNDRSYVADGRCCGRWPMLSPKA
eukprot:6020695-Prymnesium_polylepis.1